LLYVAHNPCDPFSVDLRVFSAPEEESGGSVALVPPQNFRRCRNYLYIVSREHNICEWRRKLDYALPREQSFNDCDIS